MASARIAATNISHRLLNFLTAYLLNIFLVPLERFKALTLQPFNVREAIPRY